MLGGIFFRNYSLQGENHARLIDGKLFKLIKLQRSSENDIREHWYGAYFKKALKGQKTNT